MGQRLRVPAALARQGPATQPLFGPGAFLRRLLPGRPGAGGRAAEPVVSEHGRGMAMVQVAETLGLRQTLVGDIMIASLLRQGVLVAMVIVIVIAVVQRATRPVRRISAELQQRPEGELTRIRAPDAPSELLPLIDATNQLMGRLQNLLDHQKRFVRDTSHQLRTPLAVLKVQVQSALRGDIDPQTALREINATVERATQLANQM